MSGGEGRKVCSILRAVHASLIRVVGVLAIALAPVGLGVGCGGGAGAGVGTGTGSGTDVDVVGLLMPRVGDGEPVDFAAFRGKVVVVQFFATWSLAAEADVALLKKARATYGDRVQLVGVALDPPESAALVAPFMRAVGIDYPVALASALVRRGETAFGRLDVVPTTVLIDRRGHVRSAARGPLGARALQRAIEGLL